MNRFGKPLRYYAHKDISTETSSLGNHITAPTIYSSSEELLLYVRVNLGVWLPTSQLPLEVVGSLLSEGVVFRGLLLEWGIYLKLWYAKKSILLNNTSFFVFLRPMGRP